MNTSYTINTALSKGVESITRHHSPLTTEYISFQHIYKSYSGREKEKQREKKQRWGVTRGREKARYFYVAWIKNPDFYLFFIKSIQGYAVDQYIWDGQQLILLRTGSKTTNKDISRTIGKPDLVHTNRGLAVWQVYLLYICKGLLEVLQHLLYFVFPVEYSRAAMRAVQ